MSSGDLRSRTSRGGSSNPKQAIIAISYSFVSLAFIFKKTETLKLSLVVAPVIISPLLSERTNCPILSTMRCLSPDILTVLAFLVYDRQGCLREVTEEEHGESVSS